MVTSLAANAISRMRGDAGVERQTVSGVNRRAVIKGTIGGAVSLALGAERSAAQVAPPLQGRTSRRPLDFRPFEDALGAYTDEDRCLLDQFIPEATAPQLQDDLDAGRYSGVDLATYYIDRIRRIDVPRLRSIVELNPDLLVDAAARDAERAAGQIRGPLHGIPTAWGRDSRVCRPFQSVAGSLPSTGSR